MSPKRSLRSQRLLATGSVLCTVGAGFLLYALIFEPAYTSGSLAFPIGFVDGIVMGLGAALVLWNLRSS